jgi:hypothetical protein
MHRMQTRTDSLAPAPNWLDPFGSWEAAARWNAIASEWMTRGWKQWLELVTVWPALEPAPGAAQPAARALDPVQAGTQEARNARVLQEQAVDSRHGESDASPRQAGARRAERASAKASPKRSAAKRAARPQAAAGRSARTRG